MKLKKTAAMVISATCLTVCAGMSMSASAAGVSTSFPNGFLGDVNLNHAEESESIIESYKKVILDYAEANSCSFMYTLLDMDIDGDRIEELIIAPVEPAEGRVAEIYSYIDGSAVKVGEVPMGENGDGVLCYDSTSADHASLVVVEGESGSRKAIWYSADGASTFETKRADEAEVSFDDILELGGTIVTYNGDGTWTTVDILGETVGGIDMWLIDTIVGDDNDPDEDDPFEFPEIPADATPVEETLIVYDAFMRYLADDLSDFVKNDDEGFSLEKINFSVSVFDLNKDEIPELIVGYDETDQDFVHVFFSYDPETKTLLLADETWDEESKLCMDMTTGQLCILNYSPWLFDDNDFYHGYITWYDYNGGYIESVWDEEDDPVFETKKIDDIECNIDDPFSTLFQYGDFVEIDSSNNTLYSDGAWQHVVGEDVFDGFDTSVFDRYLENYNAAQTPTDTTASGTTTSANSTTTAATTTAGKTDSPKTGDNALPMLGAVITIAGLTAFTLRKKND